MPEQSVAQTEAPAPAAKSSPTKRLLQVFVSYVWFIGTLFVAAGRLNWTRGWIAVAMWVIGMTVLGVVIHHYNPQLLVERAKWRRKDTKRFDKIFMAMYIPLVMLQPTLAGLDAGRYHWSAMPFALVYPGVLLFVLSVVIIGWGMVVNPYAEASVRIQTDRGQTVITSGAYRFVRHPMYVGMILMYTGTPLVWGSVWALALSAVTACLVIWRTSREDQTLRRELPGYEEYAARTRYRLLPGLW
jgi:protein-S-isoprenylcysteine O-methyltransferase Ste14